MPGNSLLYSDIDPNVIELLYRRFKTPIEQLIDNKLQRRQLWGPTFKQEDIYDCDLADADFRIPEPENGKRTWVFSGTLTASRVIRVPPIVSAWWFVFNKTDQPLTFLIDPVGVVGPTVPAGALGAIITDGEEIFGLTGGDGGGPGSGDGVPGGTPTQLQYKLDATTFGGATGSSVSGANIGMGGTLTVAAAQKSILLDPVNHDIPYLEFDRGGADLVDGDRTGGLAFKGRRSGVSTQTGYLRSFWSNTDGATVELGNVTATARLYVTETASVKTCTMAADTHFLQVQTGGVRISGGGNGAIFYQDSPFYTPLELGLEGQVLRVSDIGGGVLRPRWGAAGAGATPGLPFGSLQFNNAGSFGGVPASQVTGTTVKLGGILSLNQNGTSDNSRLTTSATGVTALQVFEKYHDTDPDPMAIEFRRARGNAGSPNAIGSGQGIGKIRFGGWDNGLGDFREYGYLIGQYDSSWGGIVRLGVRSPAGSIDEPGYTRIEIQDTGTGGSNSITLWAGNTWTQWNQAGIRFPFTTEGLLLYTNALGYLNGISPTTNGHVLTLVTGMPAWAAPTATGTSSPGLPVSTLQFNNAGAFGGVPGSVVSGDDIYMTGFLNVNQEVILNEAPGYITFRGDAGATIHGFIRGFGAASNGVMEIACGPSGIGPRVEVQEIGAVGLLAGSNFFYVQTDGTRLAIGAHGSIFWKNSTHYLVPLAIAGTVPAPVYLKATGVEPFWSAIGWNDITGVLPIAKGGTGTGSAPPPGYLLIGNASGGYTINKLTADTGIVITEGDGTITIRCTVTPGSGATPPGGSSPQLQFNNGGVFGGVPGSYVADDNITLTGNLTFIHEDNLPVYVNFHRWGSNLTHLDGEVGLLNFYGLRSGVQVLTGFLRSYWDDYFGAAPSPIIEIGHSGTVAVRCSQGGAGLIANAHYVIATTSGIRMSVGAAQGSMFYQNIVSGAYYVTALALDTGTPYKWLRAGGSVPAWQTITAGSNVTLVEVAGGIRIDATGTGGGTPGTPVSGLQWNNAGTFDGVENSAVTTGGLVTLGEQSATLNNAVLTLQSAVAGNGNLTNGHSAGRILFQGQLSGMQDFGVLEGLYNTTPLRTLRLGQGLSGSAYRVIALKDNGEIYLEVSNASTITNLKLNASGITLTPGTGAATNYGTYVRDGNGYIVTTGPGGAGTYLRSSSISLAPTWQALAFSDFTTGTLPVARGGTNLGTTPSNGQLLIGNGSGYALATLTQGSNITITNSAGGITIAATGGSVSPPLTLTYAPTTNSPTLIINHTQSGSSTYFANVYGQQNWFKHGHSGSISGASISRVGHMFGWDNLDSGTGGSSTQGDIICQLYAQNTGSISRSSYKLTALMIESYHPAVLSEFTALRIKYCNATTRRAIVVDTDAGDVIFNSGTNLAQSATYGFLFVPLMNLPGGSLPGAAPSGAISVPAGTCALVMGTDNTLWANRGGGWMRVFFGS